MAAAKDKKMVDTFAKEMVLVKAVYDFAKDGGAVGVVDLMETSEATVLHRAWVNVKTAVVSGGAATVEIGVAGGDTDAVLPAQLQAALTAPKTFDGDAASKGLYLASGAKLSAEIKVAALTAGKIELCALVSKF